MKTLILAALMLTGLALSTPDAQARDRHYYSSRYHSYGCERPSYHSGYYRSYYAPRYSYSRSYYGYGPRYYYGPSARYYSSYRCGPVHRVYFRPPLISFAF